MKKFKSNLSFWAHNAFYVGMAYLGYQQGIEGFEHVIDALAFILLFLSFFFFTDEVQESLRKRNDIVCRSCSNALNFGLAIFFIFHGAWMVGLAWLILTAILIAAYEQATEEKEDVLEYPNLSPEMNKMIKNSVK